MEPGNRGELINIGKQGDLTAIVLAFLPRFAQKHFALPGAILVKRPGNVTAIGNIPVMQDDRVTPYCAWLAIDGRP